MSARCLIKNTAEINKETTLQLKMFSGFNNILVEPEKVEKYQSFMPGADERIFAMMEKEQEHYHQLEKKQIDTWSRVAILKMWLLVICSLGIFSLALLCVYQGKIKEGIGLSGGGGGITAVGMAIFKTLKGR